MTNKWKKILLCFAACIGILTACGKENSIVGTWITENNKDIIRFDENGTCSVPFTYNASWMESADHYNLTEEGKTLVLSSQNGHADDSYEKASNKEEALEEKNTYYLSEDTLIIEGKTYLRTN